MPAFIDSHCHLDGKQFDSDRDAAVERARAAGVEVMVPRALRISTLQSRGSRSDKMFLSIKRFSNRRRRVLGIRPSGASSRPTVSGDILCLTMIAGYMEEKSICATFPWSPMMG